MQKIISLKLRPEESENSDLIKDYLAQSVSCKKEAIYGFKKLKQSIDARGSEVYINLKLQAFINEPFSDIKIASVALKDVSFSPHEVLIIGAGPAGLFAALKLIEKGIKPVILERGKDVRSRRRDLAVLNKQGIINPESNYCFGEGGAGTYSDGKLYTRSTKRGDVNRILNILVQFGADNKILYESHPHIGTNKLPGIITSIRNKIKDCGGEILFETKVTDFIIEKNIIKGVTTFDERFFPIQKLILATGHSARDIFEIFHQKDILIEPKPFAFGVRVEHPQALINSIQYHGSVQNDFLPPASYTLKKQVDGRGVFSFCMCPGGIIATASTNKEEIVVNGWSPSKRNNPFANSGIAVQVEVKDAHELFKSIKSKFPLYNKEGKINPLILMEFQSRFERKAYEAGGGNFVAPAQRMIDFCNYKISGSLPVCSYLPGLQSINLSEVLPDFVFEALRNGFKLFDRNMKGFFTNEACVVGVESRTSSPVRIPRDKELFCHPQISNLFPCGEGAGFAGGIVSAAMDGEKVAASVINHCGIEEFSDQSLLYS